MTSGPLLIPNLGAEEVWKEGAEEGGGWQLALQQPRVEAAARLWRWLFARTAVVAEASDIDWGACPASLAPGSDLPAFEWLEAPEPCVPWLGTQAAQRAAATAGRPYPGPAPEIVSRVHDKAFAARAAEDLGLVPRSLRGTTRVFDPGELEDTDLLLEAVKTAVASWPEWTRRRFTLKPRHGTSGRGRFDADAADVDLEKLRRALPRLARQGGAVLEPWLERSHDLSAQIHIDTEGSVTLLGSLELLSHRSGAYRGHQGQIDSRGRVFSGHVHDEPLRGAAGEIANTAREAGFSGPAGLDAFCFRDPTAEGGDSSLRPIVELNARFTMGTVVIGLLRRLLALMRAELELEPGERRAFRFELDAAGEDWEMARGDAGSGAILVPLGCERDEIQPAILFSGGHAQRGGQT